MAGGRKASSGRDRHRQKSRPQAKSNSPSRSGDEFEFDLDAFNAVLRKRQLYVRDVTGDGSCLFRATSDQLCGNENLHRELRARATKYMRDHPDSFAPFIDSSTISFEEYVEEMSRDNVWGGNLELQALSMALVLDVRIHQLGAPVYDIKNNHGRKEREPTPIHLSYHDGQHYASVRRLDEGENHSVCAGHATLSMTTNAISSKSSAQNEVETEVLTEAKKERDEIDKKVANMLKIVLAADGDGSKASRLRLNESQRKAFETEVADIRDLAYDAVKRAAGLNAILLSEDEPDYDKSVARRKKKVHQLLEAAHKSSQDLEERVSSLTVSSQAVREAAPAKRPSKKKAQQAKMRERKNRRLREQERNAVGDVPVPQDEAQSKNEVAI